MLRNLARTLLPLAACGMLLGGCGDDPDSQVASAAEETKSEQSQPGDQGMSDLKAPTVRRPVPAAPALKDAVSFVDCAEADRHVDGALRGAQALTTDATDLACFIEVVEDDPRRYAGALVVDRNMNVPSLSILDVIEDGGVAVLATAGAEDVARHVTGSDPNAPGGGYAEFAVQTRGREEPARVVRVSERNSQAILGVPGTSGRAVRVDVTAARAPSDVVTLAQSLAAATS